MKKARVFTYLAMAVLPASIAVAQAADAAAPGEVIVEPPTLNALGLEWPLQGDANRNATVSDPLSSKGYRGLARPGCRCCASAARRRSTWPWISLRQRCSPAVSSIFEPDTTYEIALRIADPDGVAGPCRAAHRGAHPRRSASATGWPHLSRVSAGLPGRAPAAGLQWPAGGIQPGCFALRLVQRLPSARAAGRRHPGACRPLQGHALSLRLRHRHAVRRHLLPDRQWHRRAPHRHPCGGRWSGGVRWRWQRRAVRCHGGQPPLFRGPDVPQHRSRHPGGPQAHHRFRRPDGEVARASRTWAWASPPTGPARRTSTSPTTSSSAGRFPIT